LDILGNGVQPTYVAAYYNGDYNIPYPTQVDPLNLRYYFQQTPYHCVQNHSADYCNTEMIPIPTYVGKERREGRERGGRG
jgi:hypothetical protein